MVFYITRIFETEKSKRIFNLRFFSYTKRVLGQRIRIEYWFWDMDFQTNEFSHKASFWIRRMFGVVVNLNVNERFEICIRRKDDHKSHCWKQ